jgi:predicted amidohydrolase
LGSLPITENDKLFNRSILINPDGDIISIYDKIHMFDITLKNGESYKESDFYSPGSELKMTKVMGHSVGHTICYDLRYPKMYRALAKKGSQIIVIPSAFTHTTGKAHWHSLIKARAIENGVFILAPNQWGVNNENRSTYGHSLIIDPWGEILAEADNSEMIVNAELDLNRVLDCQNAIPVLDNDRNFD